ncbi:Hsp70 family protein [Alienimonas chondri]|uniref:Chaperone protein DnaK n=1 Tax=Alienimonas chondri TaxID=2681879 RepID=A0ABX1VER6_9PLAN|nr:Hsp70 family protein [Alienimonas chondri]NNJ25778.1 Chaperone protein DnaK [Alienimonas chondri]
MPAPAVGIDLGTTRSVVAWLGPDGRPETIPNAEGDRTTPSVVLLDPERAIVGTEALRAAVAEPDRVAELVKRDMGKAAFSKKLGGKAYPPEALQSLILAQLKRDAEAVCGPIDRAVVTVPAFFDDRRRRATRDAADLADLKVTEMINEPTAAAVAFGTRRGYLNAEGAAEQREQVLVYDLGGGTFDVTAMRIEGLDFKVLATEGDVLLGGADWDARLADYLAEAFKAKHGLDPRTDPSGLRRLLREAEAAKKSLTALSSTTVTVEHLGQAARIPVSREQFEELTSDLLARTLFTSKQVLKKAGMSWDKLTRVLLVGGSSRMTQVKTALQQESGLEPDASVSADEAVAHGAAVMAGLLRDRTARRAAKKAGRPIPPKSTSGLSVADVCSHAIGVEVTDPTTKEKRTHVLIPGNTSIPAEKSMQFRTVRAGQAVVTVNVTEGADAAGRHGQPVGTVVVDGLPTDATKPVPVSVTLRMSASATLSVRAEAQGKVAEATLERDSGLSDDDRARWRTFVRDDGVAV